MNVDNLKTVIPSRVLSQLPQVIDTFNINTPLRVAHFLAQCAHESWNFSATTENLNYSAQALLKTFKKYFPTEEKAMQYARKPEQIGNLVYANRMGNGPVESGEGFKYRGRGYIQLTGKVNYAAFDKVVSEDILSSPELVATKYPLLSAAWFWNSRGLNKVADMGGTELEVARVTRVVNGGSNGLTDRIAKFNTYYPLLS